MTLLTLLLFAIAQAPAPSPDVLTAAHLDRLKTITLSSNKTGNLEAPVMKMLGLGKDGDTIVVKQFKADTAIGLYVLTIPIKPATDDIVFSFRELSGATYNYLSDSKRTLRTAMVSDADGNRPLNNDEAAEGFRNSLKAWDVIAGRVKFP